MRPRGFTLVEVLVALVVLEVGLTGVVGTLLLAAGTLTTARRTEAATAALERVYDSLAAAEDVAGTGRVVLGPAEVRWMTGGTRRLTLRVRIFPDTVGEELEGRRWPGPGGAP